MYRPIGIHFLYGLFTLLTMLCIGVYFHDAEAHESDAMRVYHAGDDTFVAGERVDWNGDTRGELFAAGEAVSVQGAIGGDVLIAAGAVVLRGVVGDDVYAVGETVQLAGHVHGGVRVAGRTITLTDDSRVDSGLSATAALVTINGQVEKYAQIAANRVRINGQINGDAVVSSNELVLGPDAVVRGNLIYRGAQPPVLEAGARVIGVVRHTLYEGVSPWLRASLILGGIAWLVGWLIVGALCIVLAPASTLRVSRAARTWPWQAPLIGLAVVLFGPAVIGMLAVSILGIPLALVLLLAYLLLLPIGYLAGVAALSDWIAERSSRPGLMPTRTKRVGLFVLVLLTFAISLALPLLGWLANVLAVLHGIGAALLSSRQDAVAPERRRPSSAIGGVPQH